MDPVSASLPPGYARYWPRIRGIETFGLLVKSLKKPQGGLENIGELSGSKKWVKELAGLPTYGAAALLGITFLGQGILVSFAVFVCFLMMYHIVYAFLFPGFDIAGKKRRLVLFVMGQVVLWVTVFLALRLLMGWPA